MTLLKDTPNYEQTGEWPDTEEKTITYHILKNHGK